MPNNLWNAPIEKIGFADVVSFCAAQLRESVSLDYKENFSSTNAGKQIAKEVSALANTYGGLIIYGVSETGDRLPEQEPKGKQLGDRPRDRVIQACHANIFPPLAPEVSEYLPSQDKPGQGFLVIRMPASPAAPHSVEDGKRTYVRVADKSEPDDIHQSRFEAMLERRRTRQTAQVDRVDVGIARLMGPLHIVGTQAPDPTGYLAVAIGPTIMDTPNHAFAKTAMHALGIGEDQLLCVSNGLYCFDETQQLGFLADDFGNIICVKSGENLAQVIKPTPISSAQYSWIEPNRDTDGIDVIDILEPLILMIDAMARSLASLHYFGEIKVFVEANALVDRPLFFRGVRGHDIVAATMTDESVQLEFSMSFPAIGPEGWNASVLSAEKLLWAWGRHRQARPKSFLDFAEKRVFGEVICGCGIPGHGPSKPGNHAVCLTCREKALEGS